jgi:hypothetical protein
MSRLIDSIVDNTLPGNWLPSFPVREMGIHSSGHVPPRSRRGRESKILENLFLLARTSSRPPGPRFGLNQYSHFQAGGAPFIRDDGLIGLIAISQRPS